MIAKAESKGASDAALPASVRRWMSLFGACVVVSALVTVAVATTGGERAASGLTSTTQSIPYAWGSNSFGQLGNASTATSSATPTNVSTSVVPGFVDIAAGGLHTVAIGTDGNLYTWGANESGQLGQGSATDVSAPREISPSDFASGTTFQKVAAGSSFTLALTADGSRIYSWGSNMFGQLGNATTTSTTAPVLASTPSGVKFSSIAAGSDFALALTTTGEVYAWGDNGLGQLGDGSSGSNTSVATPQLLPASDFSGGSATQISAGNADAFALVGGTIYAWGDGSSGQLGDALFSDSSVPVAANAPLSGFGTAWSSVSAGSDFTIGLTNTGSVLSWGDNQYGELGNGNKDANCSVGDPSQPTIYCSATPVQVVVPVNTPFTAVAAGYSQGYALASTGTAWSWGNDQYGQLGDNGVGDPGNPAGFPAPTPQPVTEPSGTNAAHLYSGSQASFGFLVTGRDQSYSTGFPAENQRFGNPDFLLTAPTVSSGLPVKLAASGGACAIRSEPQPGVFLIHLLSAGTCTLTASQAGSDVYNPAPSLSVNYQIAQVPLTVSANSATAPAGQLPSSFSYVVSGFINGDTQGGVVRGSASCTTPATNSSKPGRYSINCTAGSLSAQNYSFSNFVPGTLTLTAVPGGSHPGGSSPGGSSPGGSSPAGSGYHLVATDGGIFSFGPAQFYGSTGAIHLNKPIVGIADTPRGGGYWMVASDGGIFSFGDAQFYGSTGAIVLNKPIVGMASTPDGHGYWMVASDGGIFSFGDAQFFGSTGAIALNKPIVGMASTPDGHGYWMVASDGGIFSFGDAQFYGSTGAIVLNKPIVGMAASSDGRGYYMVASDGGIFTFGDAPFEGSAGGLGLTSPVIGMMRDQTGSGYWIATANGGIYVYGAPFNGSLLGVPLNAPIAGIG